MHLSKQWFFGSPPTVTIDPSHPITHNLINYTTFVASVSLSSLSLGLACTVKAGNQNIDPDCISISLKPWISILFRCIYVCMCSACEYDWPIPMFSIQPEPFQHISTLPIDFPPVLQDLRVGTMIIGYKCHMFQASIHGIFVGCKIPVITGI